MTKQRILVVDDETGMLEVCGDILKKLDRVEVVLEQHSLRAAEMLKDGGWDLLISDIKMPHMSGIDLIRLAIEKDPTISSIIITAFPKVETAVESMKLGAADYLTKPFLPDDLLATARRLLETKRLREERNLLQRQVERRHSFGEMIGQSSVMQNIFELIQRVAEKDVDVLITGETGTGKELVARALHEYSTRKGQRFVPVDCGSIPDDLLESEFFGHERGAFTGAYARSLGLMEYASGGTFFLDEIAELPIRLQAKLLRALQERRIRRIGGDAERDVDIRVVAATARDLEEEIKQGRFRQDLFYRINVVHLKIPPLRERDGDIKLLTDYFITRFAKEMGSDDVRIDQEVHEVFARYSWPGNVRELQNVVKRVLAITRKHLIMVNDLPDGIVAKAGNLPGGRDTGFFEQRNLHTAAFEKDYLDKLLNEHNGDVTKAAAVADLPRGTLYRLLGNHGLDPATYRN